MTNLSRVSLNAECPHGILDFTFRAPGLDSSCVSFPRLASSNQSYTHAQNKQIRAVTAILIHFLPQTPILFLLLHPETGVFLYKPGLYPGLMGICQTQAVAIQIQGQHLRLL